MPQPLASKEASLFRQVVRNYESKQHKKGIKAADQVLRKNANHGDTQAMKALILNSMGQSDEAFALAKVALKNDMKSHVCWHVYGLLYRSQRNYEEALKAYKFALKLEPDSPQIQRDLSLLQAQTRDFLGYIQSRKAMLQNKSHVRQNWTALAIAHHLAGELAQAEHILGVYEGTLKQTPPKTDSEHSEAVLYKNTIIAEMGEYERALEHLESISTNNLDRTAVMELRAQYLLKLDRKEDAQQAYRDLLARNSEYRAYYDGLEQAMGFNRSQNRKELKELYGSYAQKHDRLDAARRIPLDFLEGDDFRAAADEYLRAMLTKGVPSTFNNVKSLYIDPAKREALEDLVLSYSASSQTNGVDSDPSNSRKSDRFHESTLYFLAQHYNHKHTRDLSKALSYTSKLIKLSPKTYDYHMTFARIQKHLGYMSSATSIMNTARELDTRDRYINTKCAKYQIRNEENDLALKTMSKFTRNEVVGGTLGDLIEMQALWYLTEDGESYAAQGRLGLALKRLHTVHAIFETWQEDQFDFHTFSLRKGQIRAYVDMIRWEDRLREHPFFARAAIDAINVYIRLYDHPELAQDTGSLPNGDAKAAKKAREKEEREEAQQREADRKVAAKKGNLGADGEVKKSDDDPKGKKLVETKEPLMQAMKFLGPLLEHGEGNLEAQLVGFEVYIRRRKLYLALKCLLSSFALSASTSTSHPTAHEQAIRLLHILQTSPPPLSTPSLDTLTSSLPSPYATSSKPHNLRTLNDTILSQSSTPTASQIFAHIRARQVIDPTSKSQNLKDLHATLEKCKEMTVLQAVEAVKLMRELGGEKGDVDAFVQEAEKRWPEADVVGREGKRRR
ncbi:MAG: hypothetical protein M1828_002830 [Chrysothrix sp. TS-e1954]|nr:MAG: hypothetical protein M1828_002830 [Chrysothrix sp. TS-e1954]